LALGGWAANLQRPCFLAPRLELGNEALPFQVEVFVFPRHADLARFQVGAILVNEGDVDKAAAAHGFGQGQPNLLPGDAGRSPIALDHPLTMLDFNEGPAGFVARPPHGHEFLAGLQFPIRRGQQMRHLEVQPAPPSRQDPHGKPAGDRLAELVLRLDDRAIGAGGELKGQPGCAVGARSKTSGRHHPAQGPVAGIGQVQRGRVSIFGRPEGPSGFGAAQRRTVDLCRRPQRVNLDLAGGGLRFAIEHPGLQFQFHGLGIRLPVVGADPGFQGGVAHLQMAAGGARFARAVGHVRMNLEHENRLILLRHLGIGPGVELNLE